MFIDSIVVAGGDQGLLNMYFSDWAYTDITKHLPFIYNVVSQAFYSYLPAFKQWVLDMPRVTIIVFSLFELSLLPNRCVF